MLLGNLQADEGLESSVHDHRPDADMIRIPGGTFRMGSDRHYLEEAPAHRVTAVSYTHLDVYKRQVDPPPNRGTTRRERSQYPCAA